MASIQLKPPQPFNLSKQDKWPRWKRRYKQYRHASGLATEDDMRQVSILLYCLGQEADDVQSATGISEEDSQKYDKVMEKLEDHFKVRKNVIFERACFNRRNQRKDRRTIHC